MPEAKKAPAAKNSARNADLARALEHHRAGRLDEAAHIYQRLCAADRRDSDVLFLMGVLCCDLGAFEPACRFLRGALEVTPRFPEATGQLAIALNGLGDLQAAAGNLTEAELLFEQALKRVPDEPRTLRSLGRVALLRQKPARAEEFLEASLKRDGEHAEALNWLGLARLQSGKYPSAEAALRHSLRLRPDLSQARNNLGLALHWQQRFLDAQRCFEEALALEPQYDKARLNLANTLRILGDHTRARHELETVLAVRPDAADALNNLGAVFQDMGLAEQALASLSRAAQLAPEVREIHWNLGLTQLQLGDFKNGWSNFESRWDGCGHLKGVYQMPLQRAWRGEPVQGKTLLLWAEQGYGDTLQFIRFAQDVAARGARVYVLAPAELAGLLRSAPGVSNVFTPDAALPAYDFHCPLMSLPHHLNVLLNAEELHGSTAYLSVAAHRSAGWRSRLLVHPGLKVGLAWAGRARPYSAELAVVDKRRNVPFELLTPILAVAGCSFFSLQKSVPHPLPRSIHDYTAEWSDFSDTAAFVLNLDVVITVDTAIAHLAGALGTPVWLMNRHDSCWRWLLQRNDSPWYTGLRQFRQQRTGAWDAVVAEVVAALDAVANPPHLSSPSTAKSP